MRLSVAFRDVGKLTSFVCVLMQVAPFGGGPSTPEISLDDRSRQKHVSFDSSSLMRSQTLATMDEASFQKTVDNTSAGIKSSNERLLDSAKSDFEYYSECLPPELARQLMLGKS